MPIDATTKMPLRLPRHAVAILQTVFKRLWPASPVMLALVSTTIIALCAYIALTAVVYVAQRSLMYFPDTAHVLPAAAGLPEAEEVPLTAADGVRIAAWHVPPRDFVGSLPMGLGWSRWNIAAMAVRAAVRMNKD